MKTKTKKEKEFDKQLEEVLSKHHKWMPKDKAILLYELYIKPMTILQMYDEVKGLRERYFKAETLLASLYKWRGEGDLRQSKQGVWSTTKKGWSYYKYTSNRMKNEFHGIEVFEEYKRARRKEAIKRKREEKLNLKS